ncbi:GDP-mannose 4,6-dehydratase [Patescibacteria group bacterium]|nr:GDP-mannose 4,6-dehydratase [Patescibacteria group bacterium]
MESLEKYYKGKNVLVTGGAGFCGSHLAEKLLTLGANVTIYDNLYREEESLKNLEDLWQKDFTFSFIKADILDLNSVKSAVKDSELVFHFAALPSHRLALKEPRNYAEVDIIGTVNVLEAARLIDNPPKILFSSSNKVYGKQKPPFKEDGPVAPEGPYGQAKIDAEEWCKQYSKYYGLSVIINRLHHIIGPRSQPDLALSIFVERILSKKDPIVHGDFKGKKFTPCAAAFTNIYDAVDGILLSMAKINSFDILNIGASKETTVLDLAKIVKKLLDSKVGIKKKQMYEHESLHHAADPTKAKKLLGWSADTPVEKSVQQYIEWRVKTGKREAAKYKEG